MTRPFPGTPPAGSLPGPGTVSCLHLPGQVQRPRMDGLVFLSLDSLLSPRPRPPVGGSLPLSPPDPWNEPRRRPRPQWGPLRAWVGASGEPGWSQCPGWCSEPCLRPGPSSLALCRAHVGRFRRWEGGAPSDHSESLSVAFSGGGSSSF